jgi:hypothetical protein
MKESTLNNKLYHYPVRVNRYIQIIAVCGLLVMAGCKAKKQLVVNRASPVNAPKPVDEKKVRLDAIRANQSNFITFSGKARTKLAFSGSGNDATLNIRIKRDQKIWISITAIAGIEVARVLITPDSIMLINRFQSVYVRQPFSYIYKYAWRQVNYKTLESLLTGNAVPELLNERAGLQPLNGNTIITGNLQELMYKLTVGPDLRVTQTNLNNPPAQQSLQVVNSAFMQAGNYIIPSQIDISSVAKDKKIQVNLHYVKMEFDKPLDFPFIIPARYSEAN